MIDGRRVIAMIPARAGSKSVPEKNIHPLAGKPLIAHTIEVAKVVPEIDRIIVSTDGERIANVAREFGAEVYDRPAELAGDRAQVIDAIRDLGRQLRAEGDVFDIMVLLEPTAPLRRARDVRECLRLLAERDLDSVATFKEADLNPSRAWRIDDGAPSSFIEGADPWQPRQALSPAYQLNGCVYVFVFDRLPATGGAVLFGRCGAVTMPRKYSVDIDDAVDLEIADVLMRKLTHDQP